MPIRPTLLLLLVPVVVLALVIWLVASTRTFEEEADLSTVESLQDELAKRQFDPSPDLTDVNKLEAMASKLEESIELVQIQIEATKTMFIDSDRIIDLGVAKTEAYDKNEKILAGLENGSKNLPKILGLLAKAKQVDEDKLQPLSE